MCFHLFSVEGLLGEGYGAGLEKFYFCADGADVGLEGGKEGFHFFEDGVAVLGLERRG